MVEQQQGQQVSAMSAVAAERMGGKGGGAKGKEKEINEGGEGEGGPRAFDIWIERSSTNFHARQQRQAYSGPFVLDRGTAMYEDLKRRVPVPALADLRVDRGAVPLRLRRKDGEERWRRGQSLWEMWKRKQEG